MILFTVTRLSEEGDTIPFPTAYRTEGEAQAAAYADADRLGMRAVLGDEPSYGSSSITNMPDEDGCYTEEWIIARVTLG